MTDAPRDGSHVILMIGETIPDLPDVRLGQFVAGAEAAEIGCPEYARSGGWFIWNAADDWFVIGADEPLAWVPAPSGGPFGGLTKVITNSATPEGRELGAILARFCDQEAERAGRDDRCATCAFRFGDHLANGSAATLMSALKCVMEREPFWCHEHDRPCAGWLLMRTGPEMTLTVPWDHIPGTDDAPRTAVML